MAWEMTSFKVETSTIFNPFKTGSGSSRTSLSLSLGTKTVLTPCLKAAKVFSLSPPIGNEFPRRSISPVMATSFLMATPVIAERMTKPVAIPAEGPSLGVAPSGKCI